MPRNTILQGNTPHVLKSLPDQCVHMVVTSPPYWGLRSYGTSPQIWDGDVDCRHEWSGPLPPHHPGQVEQTKWKDAQGVGMGGNAPGGSHCVRCGAWRGELGLEPSPELYVKHLVDIFRQVKRVLRSDGTLWLNLGDSYWGGKGRSASGDPEEQAARRVAGKSLNGQQYQIAGDGKTRPSDGRHPLLKPKDLVGIPWRVAFALQRDGWYLRSDIIWAKGLSFCPTYCGSVMPESVRDRPSKAHEYLFLLTRSPRYYYDSLAIRQSAVRQTSGNKKRLTAALGDRSRLNTHLGSSIPWTNDGTGRNCRTVWAINPRPVREAHFATFPESLVTPCILAGTSAKGVCPKCGAPWCRVVRKGQRIETGGTRTKDTPSIGSKDINTGYRPLHTTGWHPSCSCGVRHTVPSLVLDPFLGSGTTALVAQKLSRDFIGIELKAEYVEMTRTRMEK